MSFEFVAKLPTPTEIKEQYPVPEEIKTLKAKRDSEIADVITGKSDKLLVIIGPCSADNEGDWSLRAGRLYANLRRQRRSFTDLFV